MSGMIMHIDLPIKFDSMLGSAIPDSILDQVEDDPLHIYELGGDSASKYIPVLVEAYAGTLHWVFFFFVPLSALAVVVVVFLPEYSLDRSHDGEPVKRDYSSCHPRSLVRMWHQICREKSAA